MIIILQVAFFVLLGITLAFNIFFQDGNKLFRIILTAVAVIIMKVVFTISFLKKSKASYTATLTFIFFCYVSRQCLQFLYVNKSL